MFDWNNSFRFLIAVLVAAPIIFLFTYLCKWLEEKFDSAIPQIIIFSFLLVVCFVLHGMGG